MKRRDHPPSQHLPGMTKKILQKTLQKTLVKFFTMRQFFPVSSNAAIEGPTESVFP
jgi:hypothetical protein